MARLFGTDGVRGEANRVLTGPMAYRLGLAAAYVLKKENMQEDKKMAFVIGKDTRISGDMLEAALMAGICAGGIDAYRVDVLPTPGVAVLTRQMNCLAGVVISASHNPFADNGIKFFNAEGRKLPDAIEDKIAYFVDHPEEVPLVVGENLGRIYTKTDAGERYAQFLKEKVTGTFHGLKVVVDCSNGAASHIAPKLLEDLGAEVVPIFCQPNGVNINNGCGSTHIEKLQQAVLQEKADVGLAYDGDADRLQAVDARGLAVDGDQLLAIFALYLHAQEALVNRTVVGTVMSNMGLEKSLRPFDIIVAHSKVGDRYVIEKMEETGAVLGGEQSGHIIFSQYNTTGDGILSSLKLLEIISRSGRSLADLADFMERYPQVLKNVPVKDKNGWQQDIRITLTIKKLEEKLGDSGRILVRASGTENLLRVMVEGKDPAYIEQVADRIVEAINESLNKEV